MCTKSACYVAVIAVTRAQFTMELIEYCLYNLWQYCTPPFSWKHSVGWKGDLLHLSFPPEAFCHLPYWPEQHCHC